MIRHGRRWAGPTSWAVAALFLSQRRRLVSSFGEDAPVQEQACSFQIPAPGNARAEMFRLSPDGRSLVRG